MQILTKKSNFGVIQFCAKPLHASISFLSPKIDGLHAHGAKFDGNNNSNKTTKEAKHCRVRLSHGKNHVGLI